MRIRNMLHLLSVITLVALHSCTKKDPENAYPHTKKYGPEVATSWYKKLTEITRTKPYPPPPSIRILSYTGLALYESVVPGMPSYQSIYTHLTGNIIPVDKKKDYFWPATANAAMARIASRLLSNYPNPDLAPINNLEDSFTAKFTTLVTPAQLQKSVEFGRQVADIIYEWSATDGSLTSAGTLAPCPPYVPSNGPGQWTPTPPGFFPAAGACQGELRTFTPNLFNTLPTVTPPAYSTDPGSAFYQAAQSAYQLYNTATPADNQVSQSWRDLLGTNLNTIGHLLRLTVHIIEKENKNLEEASVIFAKEGMALHDAIVVAFDKKFEFTLLRPVSYIHNVLGHTGWNSLYPTPQHPAYPSVASLAAASAVVVLEKSFGNSYAFTDSTQNQFYGNFSYSNFNQLLADVGKSRSHSGLNYVFSITDGNLLGRHVGNRITALPFKK